MNSTATADLPVIGAAHVLAVDLYIAVQDAWHPAHGHTLRAWVDLPRERKQHFIDTAKALLETYRPAPVVVATGLQRSDKVIGAIQPRTEAPPTLCIYCSEQLVTPACEPYCSQRCAINAQHEGA